jgi:osmoprotectant transport system permease protein
VLIIGITAVVAFIGVGTLGVLVFLGWGSKADDLTLLGAVPMVLMAVLTDTGLRALGRLVTSPGIRVEV